MNSNIKSSLFLFSLVFLTSCAAFPKHYTKNDLLAYTAIHNKTIISRYLPVFIIENHNKKHNLIGTPGARAAKGTKEEIFVASETPSIYTEIRKFNTPKDSYTNLIYRIHFEKVPYSLLPFYIGSGKNVGIIVVVTLNSEGLPILYTTVQTCGCYLAFIPTSYMPQEAFPDNWNKERQAVYGENLPGLLDFKDVSPEQAITIILIKNGSHRVKDVRISIMDSLTDYKTVEALIQPLSFLESLPLEGISSTSFFENSGYRKGYVKGSSKHWERFLMSWWALDWKIGQDKKLGRDKEEYPVFYTSLKPWARTDSDMRVFPAFLKYWGWRL